MKKTINQMTKRMENGARCSKNLTFDGISKKRIYRVNHKENVKNSTSPTNKTMASFLLKLDIIELSLFYAKMVKYAR